jgi:hypothetical protein
MRTTTLMLSPRRLLQRRLSTPRMSATPVASKLAAAANRHRWSQQMSRRGCQIVDSAATAYVRYAATATAGPATGSAAMTGSGIGVVSVSHDHRAKAARAHPRSHRPTRLRSDMSTHASGVDAIPVLTRTRGRSAGEAENLGFAIGEARREFGELVAVADDPRDLQIRGCRALASALLCRLTGARSPLPRIARKARSRLTIAFMLGTSPDRTIGMATLRSCRSRLPPARERTIVVARQSLARPWMGRSEGAKGWRTAATRSDRERPPVR